MLKLQQKQKIKSQKFFQTNFNKQREEDFVVQNSNFSNQKEQKINELHKPNKANIIENVKEFLKENTISKQQIWVWQWIRQWGWLRRWGWIWIWLIAFIIIFLIWWF